MAREAEQGRPSGPGQPPGQGQPSGQGPPPGQGQPPGKGLAPGRAQQPGGARRPRQARRPGQGAPAGRGRLPGQDGGDELEKLPLPELQARLEATPDGLSSEEARRRLDREGPNELREETKSALRRLAEHLWGPIPWMIEIAAVLSAVLRHWADFIIVTVLLSANAAVGFWEEYQAGNAIAALKARLAPKSHVRRDGKWVTIAARELVPGDVVHLRLGDIVPADVRVLEGEPVEVDQSALTGESLPVTRGPGEALFSGSILRRGEVDALVHATGTRTFFGKTAQLVQEAHSTSHLQQAVVKIGDFLILVAVALVVVILVTALFRGSPMTETLQFALVLTVAAIPVAMPTVLSVTMAVGARLLAAKQTIVSRLASIEELAGMDLLCTDKTGTLTKNELTLGEPWVAPGRTPDEVILAGALASREEGQDTIDLAVLRGLGDQERLSGYHVTGFRPFDPVIKRAEATVTGPGGETFKVTKGAPQVIAALLEQDDPARAAVTTAVNDFATRGFRALGVARADGGGPWRLLGVLSLLDPPRDDSRATLEAAQGLGVTVKMVTGDQLAIARETAGQLGLGTNILDASLFGDTQHHEGARLDEEIERADGFAQVFPQHKFHIVDVLQRRGHIVGMTGDGVNDAPALKKADCGVAVSGATDAARAAADIVLLTPGLSVIIDAIAESRRIFERMTSYAMYRIAETIDILLFMAASILVFDFYPVTAIMIVMLAILNDGAILAIAYDEAPSARTPRTWDMNTVLGMAAAIGGTSVAASFGLFYVAERVLHLDRDTIRTLMYLKLSVAGHMTIFVTRTRGPFWSTRPAWILLGAVFGTQLVATVIAVYGLLMPAIGWGLALAVWTFALGSVLIEDQVKLLGYQLLDRRRARRAGGTAPVEAEPSTHQRLLVTGALFLAGGALSVASWRIAVAEAGRRRGAAAAPPPGTHAGRPPPPASSAAGTRLTTYGWVDRRAGVVHIPIDEAMRLMAVVEGGAAPPPAPGAGPAPGARR